MYNIVWSVGDWVYLLYTYNAFMQKDKQGQSFTVCQKLAIQRKCHPEMVCDKPCIEIVHKCNVLLNICIIKTIKIPQK